MRVQTMFHISCQSSCAPVRSSSFLPDLYSTKPDLTRWIFDPFELCFVSDNYFFCRLFFLSIKCEPSLSISPHGEEHVDLVV